MASVLSEEPPNYQNIGISDIGFFDIRRFDLGSRQDWAAWDYKPVWVAPDDHKIVGEVLGALRKSLGVTQDELAERLAKPQSFISSYECGQRRLDLLEFMLVMSALKADPVPTFAAIADKSAQLIRSRLRRRQKP
jgi:hypothetical protein